MDEKKIALFSKALLILCEGYCEEHGCKLIGARVVVTDPDAPESKEQAAKNLTA